jgi:hypothetical protein
VARRRASRPGWAKPVGAALIALGLLIGLSLLPQQTALAPGYLAKRLSQGFGEGVAALPALCLLVGLILFVGERFRLSARVYGLLLAYLTSLVVLHLRYPAGREFTAAFGRKGGGYLGALLEVALRRAVGEPGLWTASFLGAAGSVLLVFGLSLTDVLRGALVAGRQVAGALGTAVGWGGARVASAVLWGVGAAGRAASRGAAGSAGAIRAVVRLVGATLTRARPRTFSARAAGSELIPPSGGSLPPSRFQEAGIGSEESRGSGVAPVSDVSENVEERLEPVTAGPGDRFTPAEAREDRFVTAGTASARRAAPGRQRGDRRRPVSAQEELPFPREADRPYTLPPLSLLDAFPSGKTKAGKVDPEEVARSLERTLNSFGVEARVIRWEIGPVVTRYELQPAPGVKVQRITSLQNDIALALAANSVRLEAPIPGKSAIGVELPNERPGLVHLREILTSEELQTSSSPLAVAIGKGIAGHPIVADIVVMPHLLIAGATGAGKSVAINSMIASILFRATPGEVRFLMIDPKRVELTNYNGIPHLLSPVVTAPREAAAKLRWAIQEMESRYEMFAGDGVRNIQAFNAQHPDRPLAYILIIIDELADLMMVAPADFEEIICRLAQMTRATGIHLIVATQRPSVDVITGLIKANIPSRIAFAVTSQVDSRTILDHPGAEKLLGKGDMLFSPIGASRPTRVQGSYISDAETERLVEFWRAQAQPGYVEELVRAGEEAEADEAPADDALFADAARLVVRAGYASVSLLQRKMRIGYVRAARLVDQLEERGIVGPAQGSSPREILATLSDLDRLLRPGSARPIRSGPGADEDA